MVVSDAPAMSGEQGGFRPTTVLALILTGVFASAAFLVLSAYAPELRAAGNGRSHAQSSSAVGYAGVVRLLRDMGEPVTILATPSGPQRYPGLMVLTPDRPAPIPKLSREHDRLIVLPKWDTAADPRGRGWRNLIGLRDERAVLSVLPSGLKGLRLARRAPGDAGPQSLSGAFSLWPERGLPVGPITGFQTLEGPGLQPLVRDERGRCVLGLAAGGTLYVLSDPDLLDTQGLADRRTARVVATILLALREGQAPIAFDVSLNGAAAGPSLLKLAFQPPFLGVTLSLAGLAVLVGLGAWSRFGPARAAGRAIAFGKAALVENGSAMVRLARREPQMARRYVEMCQRKAAFALGAEHLQGQALDDFLDRWADRRGASERIEALAADAARVTNGAELTGLARRARRWCSEMTRGA